MPSPVLSSISTPSPLPFTVLLNCPSSFSQRVIKFMHFYEHTPSASGAGDAAPPQRGVGIGVGGWGERFTCTFISQSLRQTVALRSFTATPQRIKCIHPDPRYKVRPRRGLGRSVGSARVCQGWSSHSRADKQKRRIQKTLLFAALHCTRSRSESQRERERGKSVRKREQKVKGVKQNRWQRMKQQQVE